MQPALLVRLTCPDRGCASPHWCRLLTSNNWLLLTRQGVGSLLYEQTREWNMLRVQSSPSSTGNLVRSRLRRCPPGIPNNLLRRADGDFAAWPQLLDLLLHGSAEIDSQTMRFLSFGGQVGKKGIVSDILAVRRECDLKSKRSL